MDGEVEKIQCYFENSHMIFRSRYPYHYKKCSRQHPHIKHKLCPYDATHVMHPDVYEAHLLNCASRSLRPSVEPSVIHQSTSKPLLWEENENTWGTEEPVVPHKVQMDYFIYTPLIGGTKTERKQHRFDERLQYIEIENSKQASEAQTNNDKKKKKKKKKKKSNNSKSIAENVNNSSDNKPIPANMGKKAPLAEQKVVTPESLNFAKLSLRD